jgi:Tfp pilus assembly protein PilO
MNLKPLIPLIGSILLFLAVIAAYSFEYSLIGTQSAKAAQLTKSISQKTQASANIAIARSQLASLRTQEAAIDQYFISTTDIVPFLEQLASIGNHLGSTVTVASVAATPGTPYGQLNLSLQVVGSFDAVMRTLGAIEFGPYATTISNLSLSASQESPTAAAKWTAVGVFTVGSHTTTAPPPATVVTPVADSTTTATTTQIIQPILPATPVPTSTTTTSRTRPATTTKPTIST